MSDSPIASRFLVAHPEGLTEVPLDPDTAWVMGQPTVTKDSPRARYLVASADGRFVYATFNGPEDANGNSGYVRAYFRPGLSKPLEVIGEQSTNGVTPCHIALNPAENLLSVCNFRGPGGRETQGSVVLLPIGKGGKPEPVSAKVQFPGSGPVLPRQSTSHPHSSAFTSSPDRIRVADLGTDSLWSIDLSQENGDWKFAQAPSRTALIPGAGPRHVISIQNGHALFLVQEMQDFVLWLQPQIDGSVEVIERVPLREKNSGASPADVHISPDYRHLYVSLRNTNEIVWYEVDSDLLRLKQLGRVAAIGEGPRYFAISTDGLYLAVSNTNSRSFNCFQRNTETGELTPLEQSLPGGGPVIGLA